MQNTSSLLSSQKLTGYLFKAICRSTVLFQVNPSLGGGRENGKPDTVVNTLEALARDTDGSGVAESSSL